MAEIKGFALDDNGDVLIVGNEIVMISGDSLLQQRVKSVLSTNLKEWFLDWDEGIDHRNLLGKNVTEELVRYEIERGLQQVDDTLELTEFVCKLDPASRTVTVRFCARTGKGETVGGDYTWV